MALRARRSRLHALLPAGCACAPCSRNQWLNDMWQPRPQRFQQQQPDPGGASTSAAAAGGGTSAAAAAAASAADPQRRHLFDTPGPFQEEVLRDCNSPALTAAVQRLPGGTEARARAVEQLKGGWHTRLGLRQMYCQEPGGEALHPEAVFAAADCAAARELAGTLTPCAERHQLVAWLWNPKLTLLANCLWFAACLRWKALFSFPTGLMPPWCHQDFMAGVGELAQQSGLKEDIVKDACMVLFPLHQRRFQPPPSADGAGTSGSAAQQDDWQPTDGELLQQVYHSPCVEYHAHILRVPARPWGTAKRRRRIAGGVRPFGRRCRVKRDSYLAVSLLEDERGKTQVYEYAHRLLLYALRGPPPLTEKGEAGETSPTKVKRVQRYHPADLPAHCRLQAMQCMHVCENKRCLNVMHMCWGTASENKLMQEGLYVKAWARDIRQLGWPAGRAVGKPPRGFRAAPVAGARAR